MAQKVLGRATKLQRTCAHLSEVAYRLGPGTKMPTSVQLCEMFSVSPVTLNAALRELEERNLIHRRHGVGIYVSPQLQRCISLLCGPQFFQNGDVAVFWQLLVERAKARAASTNEQLRFDFALPNHNTTHDNAINGDLVSSNVALQESLMRDLASGEVQGVIALDAGVAAAQWIVKKGVPIVALAGPAPHTVAWDEPELVRLGVQALADSGCRRIALWRPISNTEICSDQEKAFRRALNHQSLPCDHSLLTQAASAQSASSVASAQSQVLEGEIIAENLLRQPRAEWPDGVLSTNDNLTRGAVARLQHHNVRIGDDLHIASHANLGSPVLYGYESQLWLLEYDSTDLVNALFDSLEAQIRGQYAPTQVRVQPKLSAPH